MSARDDLIAFLDRAIVNGTAAVRVPDERTAKATRMAAYALIRSARSNGETQWDDLTLTIDGDTLTAALKPTLQPI